MKFMRIVIFILCVLGFSAHDAYALISYTVTPLVINEEVEQRNIIEKTITLVNTGDTPVTIYPTVNNIALDAGGGITEFVPQVMSDQSTSLASWVEISRAGIDLRSGETKTVSLIIRVNPYAKPGEYHALIGFPHGGNRDEAERMVKRGDSPGTVVTATLQDKRNTLLKLSRFIVDRFVTSAHNTAASYTVRNPGEEPLIPTGEIIFYNNHGDEVGTIPVNPEKIEIPPGEEHAFTGTVPAQGLFGKYKGFLSVEYGKGNIASIQDTVYFYVFPLKVILIIMGVLLTLVIGISLYVHRKYFDDIGDDGSELLPVRVHDAHTRDPHDHDIDLRSL
jgi:hypothetical protein